MNDRIKPNIFEPRLHYSNSLQGRRKHHDIVRIKRKPSGLNATHISIVIVVAAVVAVVAFWAGYSGHQAVSFDQYLINERCAAYGESVPEHMQKYCDQASGGV